MQSRVLCWHHARWLIIISQTITRLIVIGEILVRISHLFPVAVSSQTTQTQTRSDTSPKDELTRHLSVEPPGNCSPKGGRKGVKGHLKAKANGEALFECMHCVFGKKRGQAENRESDTVSVDVSKGHAAL